MTFYVTIPAPPSPSASHAMKIAQSGQALAMIAIVAVIANAASQHFGEPTFEAMRAHAVTPDVDGVLALLRVLLAGAVLAAPSFLLVCALADLRTMLEQFEAGRFYAARASAAVRSAGEWVLWALAAKIVISPTLYGVIVGEPRGLITKLESFDVALIAFALFVTVAGRVLETAADRNPENDLFA